MATTTTIDDLPTELLTYFLSFLSGRDLAAVTCVCRRFREAARVESVWLNRCREDYGIEEVDGPCDDKFFQIYSKVLYKYGQLIGVWQPDIGPYGGLVYVRFLGNRLEGVQFLPPIDPRVRDPMRTCKLFTVEINGEGKSETICHRGYGDLHNCQLLQLEENSSQEPDVFSSKCCDPDCHKHPQGKEAEFAEWLSRETNNNLQNFAFQGHELLLMKFLILTQFETKSTYTRLRLPVPDPAKVQMEVVSPGLFKGTYGAHGIEIIALSYKEDHKVLEMMKITGDPNVPCGKVTIRADLRRPMILTDVQQHHVQTLAQIDTPDLPEETTLDRLPPQPFRVPMDCSDRHTDPPTVCTARFHSQGQIAGHDFTSPCFSPGHFVVFDEDTLGHIWLELQSFTLFSRIKHPLGSNE